MKFTEEYLKENGFPLELDLTEIIEEDKKARKIISRIIMTGAFIATHNDMKGPATHIEMGNIDFLEKYASHDIIYAGDIPGTIPNSRRAVIAGMIVSENKELGNKVIVKRIHNNTEEGVVEFTIKN